MGPPQASVTVETSTTVVPPADGHQLEAANKKVTALHHDLLERENKIMFMEENLRSMDAKNAELLQKLAKSGQDQQSTE